MADPVCGLIIFASAAGVIDYTTFDRSRRFYLREHLLLTAHRHALDAKSAELRMLFRGSNQTDSGADAVNAALRALMPWTFRDSDDKQSTFDDMVVAWYRTFGNFEPKAP